jgi:hypothetical protein
MGVNSIGAKAAEDDFKERVEAKRPPLMKFLRCIAKFKIKHLQ